jgi:hypothetical protein
VPLGPNYEFITGWLVDAIAGLGKAQATLGEGLLQVRADYLLCSGDWLPTDGGTRPGTASDHRPIWVVLKPNAAR